MKRTFIKFCGFQTLSDVNKAVAFDIDAIGFICVPNRRRTVTETKLRELVKNIPNQIKTVGVLMNPTVELVAHWLSIAPFSAIQLHGEESPQFCRELKERFRSIQIIKAFHLETTIVQEQWNIEPYFEWIDVALFDASFKGKKGGTGKRFDWTQIPDYAKICHEVQLPFWVAGGIDPSNVAHLVETYQPDGIDVSSGIEQNGVKDQDRMKAIMEKVRQIDNNLC
mgnify:CR=1 FL=1